jgi:flagellar biosynthetic protein FlhB
LQEFIILDLQLFAGEKTEKATPRKREEARKKGQVFRSTDLNSAFIILTVFAVINFGFPYMLESMEDPPPYNLWPRQFLFHVRPPI